MKQSVKTLLILLIVACICVPTLLLFAGCEKIYDYNGVRYRIYSDHAEVVHFYLNDDYPVDEQVCIVPAEIQYEGETYPVTAIGDGHHGTSHLVSDNGHVGELVLPQTVTEIRFHDYDNNSFGYLTKYTVHEDNEVYASLNGVLFDKGYKTLLRYPRLNDEPSFTIPQQTTVIDEESGVWDNELVGEIIVEEGNQAYKSSGGALFTANLQTLLLYPQGRDADSFELPRQTATIDVSSRFWDNTSLKYINVEQGNVYYSTQGNVLYSQDGNELVFRPRSEQSYFAIPSTVSVVGYNALPDVEHLFVPSSVTLFMDAFVTGDYPVFDISNIYFEGSVLPNYVTASSFRNSNVRTNVTLDEFNALFTN